MGKIMKNGVDYSACGGSSGGGSTVTVTQILSSGTKIAEIAVDGNTTELYAPSGGGGGVSGPIEWVETQEASPAYPYRKLVTDVVESSSGQSTVTGLYRFYDENTQTNINTTLTVAVDYAITPAIQKIDNIYLTENISQSDTSGSPHASVTIDTVTSDNPDITGISFSWARDETFSNGKIYAFMPPQITFLYDGIQVTAYYQGELSRVQVGTYQHTQTNKKYSLGIAQS